jgi:hypothetical protein
MSAGARARLLVAALAPAIVLLATARRAFAPLRHGRPARSHFAASGDIVAVPAQGGTPRLIVRHQIGDPEIDYSEPAWSRAGHLARSWVFVSSLRSRSQPAS